MKRRFNPIPTIITGLALIGLLAVIGSKDSIIMYHGIRMFRTLKLLACSFCVGSGLATTGSTILYIRNVRRQMQLEAQDLQVIDEQKQIEAQRQARLSVSKDIDPQDLRRELSEQMTSWNGFDEMIDQCIAQFDKMDSYQERFHKLLTDNGANTLSDTEDVVNQVEQYMCRNVRSVVNFMMVADADESGKSSLDTKLTNCITENQKLLDQTRDFIYAMTEFLNDQAGTADTRLLESYKDTLLKTIRKESVL